MKRLLTLLSIAALLVLPASASAGAGGSITASGPTPTTTERFDFVVRDVARANSVLLSCDNGYSATARLIYVEPDGALRSWDFFGYAVGQAGPVPTSCVATVYRSNGSSARVSTTITVTSD
jgi:hypothetical protein